jgi:hypothetical protein
MSTRDPHSLLEQVPWEEHINWTTPIQEQRNDIINSSLILDFETTAQERKIREEHAAPDIEYHALDFDLFNMQAKIDL